jgi:hypothetical protein
MRRTRSAILVFALTLPILLPSLAFLWQPTASVLPPCCRRDGKHHCAMMMAAAAQDLSPAPTLRAAYSECPYHPAAIISGHAIVLYPAFARTAATPFEARAVLHPQPASRLLLSDQRSRHKRGPPSLDTV